VLAPTASFDQAEINFKQVSFGFLSKQNVLLKNLSEIPLHYHIRFDDGILLAREFAASPASGIINAQEKQEISVDFMPARLQTYDSTLFVDIDEVGPAALTLPITAASVVPRIAASTNELPLGEVFLHGEYHPSFDFINNTDLYAMYEVLPEEEALQSIALYSAQNIKGPIAPRSKTTVVLNVCCFTCVLVCNVICCL
jgi:hypothetical protein